MKLDLKNLYYIIFSVLFFCSTAGLQAETLYWVGGSGSWSDVSHWSGSSGGIGGEGLPDLKDDVIINDNSFSKDGSIHFSGTIFVKSFSYFFGGS